VSTITHHLLSFLIIFTLRQPSEPGKQQPRNSNRRALAPEHAQKSSQSRSHNVIRVKLPPPVQQQQHVKLGGDSSQAINESNRVTLALLAEVSELKLQNSVLVRINKRLETENKNLVSENKSLVSENKKLASEVQAASVRGFEKTKIGLSPSKHHASNSHHIRSGSEPPNNSVPGPPSFISLRTQMERDEQDRHRRKSKEVLTSILRRFQCQICLEEHREAKVVRIDSCGHRYCRECITSYVGNKLDAKRFPIPCPVCAAEPGKDKPGSM
jgi:hypothetical protein